MAFLEFHYHSKALDKTTTVSMILPEKKTDDPGAGAPDGDTFKTIYLLHGLTGDHSTWMRKTAIERYATQYNIVVVMPEVGRTWYTDTQYGVNAFTFVTKELPEVCRSYFKGISDKREDTIVAGLSMGGYGAIKAALTYPESFGACVSLSGSLDITRRGRTTALQEWRSIFDFHMESARELENSPHDIFVLTRRNHENGIAFPKMYLWCGTEDVLIKVNRDYHSMLNDLGVEHCYEESEGDHTWQWWDLHIQDALRYLLGQGIDSQSG